MHSAFTMKVNTKKLDVILHCLKMNGFTVKTLECEWCVQETDFLGFWMTATGIKPWKERVEAVLAIKTPQTLKQLHGFIGMATVPHPCTLDSSH